MSILTPWRGNEHAAAQPRQISFSDAAIPYEEMETPLSFLLPSQANAV
jgi:hypothetical protein